jgi:hypothetical protein
MALAVSVDAAHPLFESVGVPRNVVVDEEVAELQVDAFARGLGGNQHLDVAVLETLLGIEPTPRDIARADVHRAVDRSGLQSPGGQLRQDVIERVFEFGEDEQPLVPVGEEPFGFEQAVKLGELDLADIFLDGLGQAGKALQLGNFFPNLLGVAGQGDRLKDALPAFPIGLLHFLELVFRRDFGWRLAGDVARLLEKFSESVDPIFERPVQRVGRRGQPALVEGHQETDSARPGVLASGGRGGALPADKAGDLGVKLELVAIDLKVDAVGNSLGKNLARHPFAVGRPLREIDHRLLVRRK